ncbi:MAG: amidase [Pseudomonadota bacterium]|nr:amidase [Pseudomonadota bacterium]
MASSTDASLETNTTDSVWVTKFPPTSNGKFTVGVKDTFDVQGYRTSAGSAALQSVPQAQTNADVINRLIASSVVISGKTTLHELAFGMTGVNHFTGTPVNPLFPDYICGGSSSGSAVAVAREDVVASLGTDTGGSIRVPAACCGVIGFKPTYGRVSRTGVLPAQSSLDCVGSFARDMASIIHLQNIIDPNFLPATRPVETQNVTCALFLDGASKNNITAVEHFLIRTVTPHTKCVLSHFDAAFNAGMTIIAYETYQAFSGLLNSASLGSDVKTRLEKAAQITADDVFEANTVRQLFSAEVDRLLSQYSIIATPALPALPLLRKDALAGSQDLTISYFARPFNLSGHPAIVLPITKSAAAPYGIQLIAAKNNDYFLCQVAKQLLSVYNSW